MSNHRSRVALGIQKPLWHSSTNPILAIIPKSVQGKTVASILQTEKPGFSHIGHKVQKRKFRFPNPCMVLFHTLSWADTRCWLSSGGGGWQQGGQGHGGGGGDSLEGHPPLGELPTLPPCKSTSSPLHLAKQCAFTFFKLSKDKALWPSQAI